MPQDAVHICYLAKELNEILLGGKIVKVLQPEKDEIHIVIYTKFGNKKLLFSCNANNPRCHITTSIKENPMTAPTFCMLLRKILTNGIISRVYSFDSERTIMFELNTVNEMNDKIMIKLAFEVTGRQSNLFIINEQGNISSTLKQTFFDENSDRQTLIGAKYTPLYNKDKILLSETDKILQLAKDIEQANYESFLLTNVSGLSKQTAFEIANDCHSAESLAKNVYNIVNLATTSPVVSFDGKIAKDFYIYPFKNIANFKVFNTFNEALDFFFTSKDLNSRINERTKNLRTLLKNHINRAQKKLAAQLEQFNDCNNFEENKLYGELITSNIFRIKQGDEFILADNYYSENNEQVKIKLDKNLSPSKNAQLFYKKYLKQKRTIENVGKQLIDTKLQLSFLKELQANLLRITLLSEIELINQDLIKAGLIAKPSKKDKHKEQKFAPFKYIVDGYVLYVGRNSSQNEEVTHKIGKNKDLWFHVKDYFGSHVLIKNIGEKIPDKVIVVAAEIAAYFSDCKESNKVSVDYTYVKNIGKPTGGNIGMVVYNTNWSVIVDPNPHFEFKTVEK